MYGVPPSFYLSRGYANRVFEFGKHASGVFDNKTTAFPYHISRKLHEYVMKEWG